MCVQRVNTGLSFSSFSVIETAQAPTVAAAKGLESTSRPREGEHNRAKCLSGVLQSGSYPQGLAYVDITYEVSSQI